MTFFVRDFCVTLQARVVIVSMQAKDEVLKKWDCEPASAAYSNQYLFLSILSVMKFFIKDFCGTL